MSPAARSPWPNVSTHKPSSSPPDGPGGSHLSAETISAYLDRSLGADELRGVEEHLADCPECRDEVSGAARLVDGSGVHPLRRPLTWAGVVAAAAVAGLLLFPAAEPDATRDPLRTGTDSVATGSLGISGTVIVGPVVDGEDSSPVALVWTSLGTGATYRASVMDAGGSIIWQQDTRDTTLVLPDSVYPGNGLAARYWMTDALLPDGTSATTGTLQLEPGT